MKAPTRAQTVLSTAKGIHKQRLTSVFYAELILFSSAQESRYLRPLIVRKILKVFICVFYILGIHSLPNLTPSRTLERPAHCFTTPAPTFFHQEHLFFASHVLHPVFHPFVDSGDNLNTHLFGHV